MRNRFLSTMILALAAGGAAQAARPVYITNASNRPWRLVSEPLWGPIMATIEDASGAVLTRQVPDRHSVGLPLEGPEETKETDPARAEVAKAMTKLAYGSYFTLDITLRPGAKATIETTETKALHSAAFHLLDVNDREDALPSEFGLMGGIYYKPYEDYLPLRPAYWSSPWTEILDGVATLDREAPQRIVITADSWGYYRHAYTTVPADKVIWQARGNDPWAGALKEMGIDPLPALEDWREAQAEDRKRQGAAEGKEETKAESKTEAKAESKAETKAGDTA